MLVAQYSLNPCRPAFNPEIAERSLRPVALPVGGAVDSGAKFAKGTVLGCVGGAAANEAWTITIGSATGTVTFTFTCPAGVYQTTFAYNATPAAVKTALEVIFGTGNILTVTGTAGTTYVVTFGGLLANRMMGGLVAMTATTANPTLSRSAGSCGAAQFAPYDNSAPGVARAVLKWDFSTDPQGARVSDVRGTGQPAEASAYTAGYFFVADLTGLDASAMSDPGFRLVTGAAITDTDAVIGIGV